MPAELVAFINRELVFVLLATAVLAVILVSLWKLFVKAKCLGWLALVPIYNVVVTLRIVNRPLWWLLLCLVPLPNLVILILITLGLAKRFGKDRKFALGMLFLPFIFYPILGFGKADYRPEAEEERITNPETRHQDDHLRILQAIYGILLGFGLRELVEAVLPWISSVQDNWSSSILVLICGLNILWLALRFFFIVEEVSSYLLFTNAKYNKEKIVYSLFAIFGRTLSIGQDQIVALFHYPMIITQACIFYGLGAAFRQAVLDKQTGEPKSPLQGLVAVALIEAALLAINVVWLWRVRHRRSGEQLKIAYEDRWMAINGTCAAIAFDAVVAAAWMSQFKTPLALTLPLGYFVFGTFLIGSLVDLWSTAKFYLPLH